MLTIVQVTESYAVGEEGSEMSSFGVLSGKSRKDTLVLEKGSHKRPTGLEFPVWVMTLI